MTQIASARFASTRLTAAASALALLLSGCATASKDIASAYVSPLQFQNLDCQQVIAEQARISVRVNQLAGRLDQASSNDKALVGVGMILFWPALFALGGTKEQEAEYARLRGEYDALQKVAIEKRCALPPPAGVTVTAPAATTAPQAIPVTATPAAVK